MHSEALPPEMLGGTPMCMAQHKKMYGYRRPGAKADSAWHTAPGPESKHMIVFRKGHVRVELCIHVALGLYLFTNSLS